jgi:hypothetical protein
VTQETNASHNASVVAIERQNKQKSNISAHVAHDGQLGARRRRENPLEGGKQIYPWRNIKRSKVDRKPARGRHTQSCTAEITKRAQIHKHARKGALHTMGEIKFETTTPYTQHIKYFSYSHDMEDQQDLPQQNTDTLSPIQIDKNGPPKADHRIVRASQR